MPFKLTIEQGKGRGQVLEFAIDSITLGRDDDNDVVLAEAGVSRRHARIALEPTGYVVFDLQSSNGTTVNGHRVVSQPLANGDRLGVGGAVFMFEGEVPGSTRLVSVADATAMAASSTASVARTSSGPAVIPAAPASASPAAGAVVRPASLAGRLLANRSFLWGLILAVLIGLGSLVVKGRQGRGGPRCPEVAAIEDAGGVVFGRGVDSDCEASTEGQRLGFYGREKTRFIVRYAPFFTKQGSLSVQFNGKSISDAPAVPTRQSLPQSITLPEELMKPGANEIAFVPAKGAEEFWGVERLELEAVPFDETDAAKAQEHYARGTRLYREKNVAAANLYNAWMEMRAARRSMEWIEPKPDIYRPTIDLIRDIDRELDVLCKRKLFAAQKDERYSRIEAANEAYRFILNAFPGSAHPCRSRAESGMWK